MRFDFQQKTNDTGQGKEQQQQHKICAEYRELQRKLWEHDDKQKEYNKETDNINKLIYALDVEYYDEIIRTEKECCVYQTKRKPTT